MTNQHIKRRRRGAERRARSDPTRGYQARPDPNRERPSRLTRRDCASQPTNPQGAARGKGGGRRRDRRGASNGCMSDGAASKRPRHRAAWLRAVGEGRWGRRAGPPLLGNRAAAAVEEVEAVTTMVAPVAVVATLALEPGPPRRQQLPQQPHFSHPGTVAYLITPHTPQNSVR